MQYTRTLIGIDSGLVHTGIVCLQFADGRLQDRRFEVVSGLDVSAVRDAVAGFLEADSSLYASRLVVMEEYRPRPGIRQSAEMLEFQGKMRSPVSFVQGTQDPEKLATLRASVLMEQDILMQSNMDSRYIVTDAMLKLLNLWKFPLRTNHHDLRSAARIALFAAIKDKQWNPVIHSSIKNELFIKHNN